VKPASARTAVLAVMSLRVAYGVGLLVAPAGLSRRWLGAAADMGPTQIPLQGLGAREVVMHTGIAIAAARGTALRPWLLGSIAGDLTDVAATLAQRSELPQGAALATALVGGGSALLSGLLALAVDD
jgi:hypothetical protein